MEFFSTPAHLIPQLECDENGEKNRSTCGAKMETIMCFNHKRTVASIVMLILRIVFPHWFPIGSHWFICKSVWRKWPHRDDGGSEK